MDPAALAEAHRRAQVSLTGPVMRLLAEVYMRTFDPNRPDETFPVYLAAAEQVLGLGREQSAVLARRYYMRAASGAGFVEDVVDNLPTPTMDRERVETSLRVTGLATVYRALGDRVPLAEAQRRGLAATIAAAKRITLDGGREMLVLASRRDRNVEAWARVTDGSSCAFCAMLVSRGPVYSEGTASFRSHDRCGCGVRLVFKGEADGGWTEQARQLRRLWDGDDDPEREAGSTLTLNEWRGVLNAARSDPKRAELYAAPTAAPASALAA